LVEKIKIDEEEKEKAI